MPLTRIKSLGITDGAIVGADINSTFDLTGKTVTLPAGTGGKVLQVVQATYDVNTTTSSSSYVTSGLAVSITPSSASNKILIFASGTAQCPNQNTHMNITLYRGATNLSSDGAFNHIYSSAGSNRSVFKISYLDSPNTTSSTTYTVYFNANAGGDTMTIHNNDSMSVIIAMEISA